MFEKNLLYMIALISLIECVPWWKFQCTPYVSKQHTCYNTTMPGMPEPFWIYANVSSMRHTIVGESEMYAFSHEEHYTTEVCTRLDQNVYSSIVWYSLYSSFIENGYRKNYSKTCRKPGDFRLWKKAIGIFEERRKLNLWSIQNKEVRVMMLWTFLLVPFGDGY